MRKAAPGGERNNSHFHPPSFGSGLPCSDVYKWQGPNTSFIKDTVIRVERHLITLCLEQTTWQCVYHRYASVVCFSEKFMFPAGTEYFFCLINVKYFKQSCLFLSGYCQVTSFHWVWALARAPAFMHTYPCQILVTQVQHKYPLLLLLALHSSG